MFEFNMSICVFGFNSARLSNESLLNKRACQWNRDCSNAQAAHYKFKIHHYATGQQYHSN